MRLCAPSRWLGLITLCATLAAAQTPSVLILDDSQKLGSLSLGGDNTLVVEQGDVQVNSSHTAALSAFNSSLEVKQGKIGVVGGVQTLGKVSLTPKPVSNAKVADPYAALKLPTEVPIKSRQKLFVHAGKEMTLSPGVYFGGLSFGSGCQITFEPGVYYVGNGDIYFADGTYRGAGVTICLYGNAAGKFVLGNKCDINLTAPTEGDFKGLSFISYASGLAITLQEANLTLSGAIYGPKVQVGMFMKSQVKVPQLVALNLTMGTGAQMTVTGSPAAGGE
ncbi:MAG: hypothetical protein IT204_06570 [Fimbriimonadaceae bacterium]|nr:hypothetical protein [Fimbriimonadaceae bacterium]